MAVYYLDYINGNDSWDGSSFTRGAGSIGPKKTPQGWASGLAAGDTIRIAKSPDPVSVGQSATFTHGSKTVTLLTAAVTAHIDKCESGWTNGGNANSTVSQDTAYVKQGTNCLKIVTTASQTTAGILALKDLGSDTDFSGYQQISFWYRGASSAGVLIVELLDSSSNVLHTFTVPTMTSVSNMMAVTLDNGSALSNVVRYVRIKCTATFASKTVYFDHFIACKAPNSADAITLTSLIGKNSGEETWYPIQSIDGTTILIDNGTGTISSQGRGYYSTSGTTENVPIYRRETIKTDPTASSRVMYTNVTAGTQDSYITWEGGYNTSNNTKDGVSFFDGQNSALALWENTRNFQKISNISFTKYGIGVVDTTAAVGSDITVVDCSACGTHQFQLGGMGTKLTVTNIYNTTAQAINFSSLRCAYLNLKNVINIGATASSANALTVTSPAYFVTFEGVNWKGHNRIDQSTSICLGLVFRGMAIDEGNSGSYSFYASPFNNTHFDNVSHHNANGSIGIFAFAGVTSPQTRLFFTNWQKTSTNHQVWLAGGTISTSSSYVEGTNPYTWKISPTDATSITKYVPLSMPIARVCCVANQPVTIKVRVTRAFTGFFTGAIVARVSSSAGVTDEVIVSATANTTVTETLTLTVTPTASGVCEIEAQAYGGSTNSFYIGQVTVLGSVTKWETLAYPLRGMPEPPHNVSQPVNFSL